MDLLFNIISKQQKDHMALIGEHVSYTFGEILTETKARIDIIQKRKIKVLGIALNNEPDWVLWDLAALKSGIVCVPLPPFFTAEQISHSCKTSGITHIIKDTGLQDLDNTNKANLPKGTSKITFTSGTTGTPKGVCLSKSGLEQTAQSVLSVLDKSYASKHLSLLPLSILLENVAGVYTALMSGGTVYLPSLHAIGFEQSFQPDFQKLISYMTEHKISSAVLVPELLRGILSYNPQLPDLKYIGVGGSKMPQDLLDKALKLKLPIYEGYGLSECGSVVSMNTVKHNIIGSIGKILPHIKSHIKDNELIIENPAFLGYIDQEHSGEYATGDLVQLDEHGILSIIGRKKNVLITSYGRNISPEWVESALLSQKNITTAIVYGDGDDFLSALIISKLSKANISASIAKANETLPEYAHIKSFKVIKPLSIADGTLTGNGRPRREHILKLYTNKEDTNELLQKTM